MGAGIISISAGLAILLSGNASSVSPSQMKFVGAYQTACPVILPKLDTSTTTPPASKRYIPSKCEGGTASVAQFSDPSGNTVYMDIPNSQYEAMEKVNGYQHNPTERDFDANLQAFIASTTTSGATQTSASTATTSEANSTSTPNSSSNRASTPPASSPPPAILPDSVASSSTATSSSGGQ
jgi:hypothetical protein